jgi:NADH-quinone oxidoreductase subunit C
MIEKLKNASIDVEEKSNHLFKVLVDIKDLQSSLLRFLNEFDYITLDSMNYRDDIEDGKFCITYCLQTAKRDHILMIQTFIDRENATLPTMHKIWPQAEIMEREMHEMLGVDFPGHPSLIDFCLEYWDDIPPMRRDFDTLEYVERTAPFRKNQRDDNLDVKAEAKRIREEKKAAKLKAEAEAAALNESKEDSNNE